MLRPNQVLKDRYRIIDQIGAGGGGIVYRAWDQNLNQHVAVKLIKDEVKGVIAERSEADILKNLKHEGIPQVYDFVRDGNDVYTVMEFIEGRSLFDEIVSRKKIPYDAALVWAKEICAAAAYLHSRKPPVVHSDIKPQNIMIGNDNKVYLIDFNISSVFDGQYYTLGSSDGYSPPEQYAAIEAASEMISGSTTNKSTSVSSAEGQTVLLFKTENKVTEPKGAAVKSMLDTRSDVYSIGAVIYSMLTGYKPCNSRYKVMPITELDSHIPEAFVEIVQTAMSPDMEDRFADAGVMFDALNNIEKRDRRYKRFAALRTAVYILCAVLLSLSAVSTVYGYKLMGKEGVDRIYELKEQLGNMTQTLDYSDFYTVYNEITESDPDDADKEYYKAVMLYDTDDDEARTFIGEFIGKEKILSLSSDKQINLYFIYSEYFYADEEYGIAAENFEKAVSLGAESGDLYRDYAISLFRTGDTDKAVSVTEKAKSLGLDEDSIYMLDSELSYAFKEYGDTIDSSEKCVSVSGNDGIRQHAYILAAAAARDAYVNGDPQYLEGEISLLQKAIADLPENMTMQIRESLAQAYMDMGESSGKTEYYAQAVSVLDEKKALWNDYQTNMNIAVLLDRLGDTRGCKDILVEMSENGEYAPHYYEIFVRLAYCEADIQGSIDADSRDYTLFDEYFKRAEKEYEIYSKNGAADGEIERLRIVRNDLVSLGWLKGG